MCSSDLIVPFLKSYTLCQTKIFEAWGHIYDARSNPQIASIKGKVCSLQDRVYRSALSGYTFLLQKEEIDPNLENLKTSHSQLTQRLQTHFTQPFES